MPFAQGTLFAVAVWYGWASLSAEMMMRQTITGRLPPALVLTGASAAVARFPFDPNLRVVEGQVRQIVQAAVKAKAK